VLAALTRHEIDAGRHALYVRLVEARAAHDAY
jgi:hypothetical protein